MRLPIGMPENRKLSKESANVEKTQLFQKNSYFFPNRSVSPAASSTDYSYYSLSLAFAKRLAESSLAFEKRLTESYGRSSSTESIRISGVWANAPRYQTRHTETWPASSFRCYFFRVDNPRSASGNEMMLTFKKKSIN